MASEIRVNKINSRTGVGTITLSPTGVDFTGIATVATLKATTGIVTTLTATTGIVTTLTADTSRTTTGIVTTLTADTAKVGAAVTISESGMEVTGVTTVTSSINIGSATTISSSSLEVNGVQYPTTGALSNRNLVINGAMRLAQRGTSSTSTGYLIDRFTVNFGQASITQSQQSLSSGSPYDEGFRYFHRSAVTSTSSANNAYLQLEQRIEAQNMAGSGWKYKDSSTNIICSFWARSSLAGTYYVQYRALDSASGLFYINKSFTLVADTWTKVEHVIPGNSNLVFNDDEHNGFQITIVPHYGTTYTDNSVAVGSWFTRSADNYFPDYAQNFTNTSSATFDVTGLQLEVGEKATPFEHRSYGDELLRCERYYEVIGGRSEAFMGYAYTTSAAVASIRYRTVKRDIPGTITLSSAGQSTGEVTFLTAGGSYPTTTGSHTVQVISAQSFRVSGSGYSGLTDDSPSSFYVTGAADETTTIATVDAEL